MNLKLSALIVLVMLLTACGSAAAPTPTGPLPPVLATAATATQPPAASTATSSGASEVDINIQNFDFNPDPVTIQVGTTVKWTNLDNVDHTVTADDNSFDSGDLVQGSAFSFTFTKAGTYTYHCGVHPRMKGTIIVNNS